MTAMLSLGHFAGGDIFAGTTPQRQFGIPDQSHIWAFDGNSLISFFTVSENQIEDNLPVLR